MKDDSTFNADFNDGESLNADFIEKKQFNAEFGEVIKVSTSNYEELLNLPKINDVTVIGNKTIEEYGVRKITNQEIKALVDRVFKGGE